MLIDLEYTLINCPDLYYLGFPNDRNIIKSLIAVVYIIETLQSILVAHDAFAIFVTGFGNFMVLEGVHFAWLTVCVLYSLCVSFSPLSFLYC